MLCAVSLWASGARAQAPLPPGALVAEGQLASDARGFVAGPDGATIQLDQGARLHLRAGAALRFGRTFKLPLGSRPDDIVATRVLMLDAGRMEATMPADQRQALFIETPDELRAILLSGELSAVAAESRSGVALLSGRALVASDGSWKWKRLPEGAMHVVSDAHRQGHQRALLAATAAPVLSRSLLLEGSGDDSSTWLAWPPLARAAGYEVAVRASDGGLVRSERIKEPRLLLRALPAGQYQVSVRGIDDLDIAGAPSPAAVINVVGLEIPKTASRGANGAVRLQPDQRVGLIGADGLLVAYLGLDEFLPAPKSVGLVGRRPISLLLRHPESGETVRLDLEPLSVRAQISFARHPNDWPAAGLDVSVKLVDERGDGVPDNFAVTCRVSVNVEAATPAWKRAGSTLRARIDRPAMPGPWMVRVDVLDENGASMGMDFTEVGYLTESARQERSARR